MKKFKIYGFSIYDNPVLITNSENLSFASTFDEQLKLQRYMKSDFSFKISDVLNINSSNPFFDLIYIGGKIRLELPNKVLDFVISNISSEFYKDMIVYNVSCQDYASYIYSKQGQGLSIEYTGDLSQLIRKVLGESRKNIGYKFSSDSYLNLGAYTSLSNATVTATTYSTDFIGVSYALLPKTDLLFETEYTFKFYVKSMSSNAKFAIIEIDKDMNEVEHSIDLQLGWNQLTFFHEITLAYLKLKCTTYNIGVVSISDIDLIYNIFESTNLAVINSSLHLAGDGSNDTIAFNNENFRTSLYQNLTGSESYYRKTTLLLENSNLYNALIEVAKLYNAEIQFNYSENTVNFINKDIEYQYRGYRLSPTFNLLTLSREEDIGEFSSVLRVSGADNVNLLPDMPIEFQQYFYDCIDNNFNSQSYFNTYDSLIPSTEDKLNYKYIANNFLTNYIVDDENKVLRQSVINDYANAADFIPNLDNKIYSLDYYKETNRISQEKYDEFNRIINDDLRILNIKLSLYTTMYYNNDLEISNIQNNIDFISKNLAVESILQNDLAQNFDYVTVSAGTTGTNYWTVNKIIGGGSGTNAVPLIAFSGETGTTPSYLNTNTTVYYGKWINNTTVQLYEDSSLTKIITIPSNNTNTWYLYRSINYATVGAAVLLATYKRYSDSLTIIKIYLQQLFDAYSLNYNQSLVPTGINVNNSSSAPELNTFTYYVLNNEGFHNGYYNQDQYGGIHTLLYNLNNEISILKNLNTQRLTRINVLNNLLAGVLTIYQRNSYEQEKAGLEAMIYDSKYYIGDDNASPVIRGMWYYQSLCLSSIISTLDLSRYVSPTDPNWIDSISGLKDKISTTSYNRDSLINNLYKNYENYIVEGYYENTEEITSNGLLEQALTIFNLSKYPKINYGVNMIDISSLQDYEYIDINIWDKILIQEENPRLYKTYFTEDKYLEVFEISYDLRRPEGTQLTVSQEDQIKRILQKILFKI